MLAKLTAVWKNKKVKNVRMYQEPRGDGARKKLTGHFERYYIDLLNNKL
jgi:hypothetical protein